MYQFYMQINTQNDKKHNTTQKISLFISIFNIINITLDLNSHNYDKPIQIFLFACIIIDHFH